MKRYGRISAGRSHHHRLRLGLERLETRRLLAVSFLDSQLVGTIESALIGEASGTVASRQNQDVLWTHNDSGDTARLFAMDTQGRHLGIYNITGAAAVDWEDIAIGPGPQAGVDYLYIGDIGDNSGLRSEITVYRIAEPTVDAGQVPGEFDLSGAETITLDYPDGARDAESLLVDPLNGEITLVTKREAFSRVYRAAYPQSTSQTTTMEFMGELDFRWAVGGDVSPTGLEVLIKDAVSVTLYERSPAESLSDALLAGGVNVPYTVEPQGEAITFDGIGQGYYTISEGLHQPIYYYQRLGESESVISFQQGTAGYAGTVDTQLLENTPDTDYSAALSLTIDADEPPSSNLLAQGLIRFENLFGNAPGQIPAGNEIVSAQLQLNVTNPGASVSLHRMLQNWVDTDTFSSLAGGIQADNLEALAAADASTGPVSAGMLSVDVTASLTAWLANPAENLGWALLPSGADGVDFNSAEGAIPPKLFVVYTPADPNNVPAAADDGYSIAEDGVLNVVAPGVLANDTDADSDPLSANPVTGPTNGTLLLFSDGSFDYTPDPDFFGVDSFTYQANDGTADSNAATVSITVTAVNDVPVADVQSVNTDEDASLAITLTGSDVDGDSLTYSVVTGPTNGSLSGTAPNLTYTPNANFHGSDSLTFKVNDGTIDSALATISIAVNPSAIPVAASGETPKFGSVIAGNFTDTQFSDDLYEVLQEQTYAGNRRSKLEHLWQFDVPAGVSAIFSVEAHRNVGAVDAFRFEYSADMATWITMLTVTDTTDSLQSYTLPSLTTTPLFVRVVDTDASRREGTADILSIDEMFFLCAVGSGPVNVAPVAAADAYSIGEDGALTVNAPGLLANDTDADGDPLSAVLAGGPSDGSLTFGDDGSFTYTPNADFFGADSFTYTANDGKADSAAATVTLTVTPVNDTPTAMDDSYATPVNTSLTILAPGVLGNDADPDGDILSAALVSDVSYGILTLTGDGSFTYTPNTDFEGADTFTYTASDTTEVSGPATVTINVATAQGAKFFVVDDEVDDTFHYDATGTALNQTNLAAENLDPVGAAADASGSRLWVLDSNRTVHVYDNQGFALGSWTAQGVNRPVGIASDGADVWIVDARMKSVFSFSGAAAITSGSQAADSSFALASANRKPKGITSDGASIWVVNDDKTDTVFKYNTTGTLLGSWTIDSANGKPTGITIDPTGGSDLWIVDSDTAEVFQYTGGAGRLSGSQAADVVFSLAAGNINPQGIADPPAPSDNTRLAGWIEPSSTVRLRDTFSDVTRPAPDHFAKGLYELDAVTANQVLEWGQPAGDSFDRVFDSLQFLSAHKKRASSEAVDHVLLDGESNWLDAEWFDNRLT